MRCSVLFTSALSASTVIAAPTWPAFSKSVHMPAQLETMSSWFNALARVVQDGRSSPRAPVCDLSSVKLPESALPPPSAGLYLKHVAVGRGTQNYTCDTSNPSSAPVLFGAVATLFNASCIASSYPDVLKLVPKVALQFDLPGAAAGGPPGPAGGPGPAENKMGPIDYVLSGHHFFTDVTTPFFTLDTTPDSQYGTIPCAKLNQTAAPADAPKGQQGESAVAWLKLRSKDGATGDLQEVYRVGTAGGSSPATCQGMPASFEVQYSAEYWFYAGSKPKYE
ncbi:hypothetical protein PG999_011586 [Apiospora kogelbergensis]|uniref:Malate dehydrogenase n=1 Tax=Apiospora kogelbergensis TaxID=1337665 RepID=A0AAW0QF92_9PEZI